MRSIFERLREYVQEDYFSMHMPGHKSGRFLPPELEKVFGREVFKFDLTEVNGLDNLQEPRGIILETEKRIAGITGAKRAHLMVNGSTAGLLSSIYYMAREKEIFVDANCHQGVYKGMVLVGSSAIFLEVDQAEGLPLGISPETLLEGIRKYPDCKCLILTAPNYYGVRYRLKEVITIAKDHGLGVIVDEAHGAHFNFMKNEIPSALFYGADIVIQSWHKSLPVLNQGSVMLAGPGHEGSELKGIINIFQTTSPSYLILASIDSAAGYLADNEQKILESAREIRKYFSGLIFRNLKIQRKLGDQQDPFKLLITSSKKLKDIAREILVEKYRFQPEITEENLVLLMLPVILEKTILKDIAAALQELDLALDNTEEMAAVFKEIKKPKARKLNIDPREAFDKKKKKVILEESVGKICGQKIVKYPPGVPLIFPGELLDEEIICYLQRHKINYNLQDGIEIMED